MTSNPNKLAFITGATSGIGAAYAKVFAAQGYDLLLTGMRTEIIQKLATDLAEEFQVKVDVEIIDLSDREKIEALAQKISDLKSLEIMINNAGFARRIKFHEDSFSWHESLLFTHVLATVRFTYAVLPNMLEKGKGTIINVSSVAAFSPSPVNALYSGTKSFLNMFTESLHLQFHGQGIKFQALCPGMTRTDFHVRMGYDRATYYKDKGILKAMEAEEVVDISLKCLQKDKVVCVTGLNNKLMTVVAKLLPKSLLYKLLIIYKRKKKKIAESVQ